MNRQRAIALLGRKDEPTDAIEEYCRYLGAALATHTIELEIQRFPWEQIGWLAAFAQLTKIATNWRGRWVLVQYTAIAWSARGFPLRFLRVLKILKSAGARVAIVFHDAEPFTGFRLVDRLRHAIQLRTMRRALSLSHCSIFTVPIENLSWLTNTPANAAFIPVGPNLPIPDAYLAGRQHVTPTIGVFSLTGGEAGARESKLIASVVGRASQKLGKLRLSVFGRNAELCEAELRQGLRDSNVELSVEGVLAPEQVVQRLSACDLLLFVRGPISSRRGSAIAAIACGLPVIAFSGSETAVPLTDAGVLLASSNQPEPLHQALVHALSDSALRAELASRSLSAYQQYFSWSAIAARFAAVLKIS